MDFKFSYSTKFNNFINSGGERGGGSLYEDLTGLDPKHCYDNNV